MALEASLSTLKVPFWSAAAGPAKVTITDADKHVVRTFDATAVRGMNTVEWDVKVDRDLALATEAGAKGGTAGPPKDSERKADAMDSYANARYAESVRLGHRLFAKPGKYTVAIEVGGKRHDTALDITAPEPFTPLVKPQPKIRGRVGYAPPSAEAEAREREEEGERESI